MRHPPFRIAALLTLGVAAKTLAAAASPAPGLTLTTPDFKDGGTIPEKYTEAAKPTAVSPALTWTNVPDGTVSFAVLVHDPDTALDKTAREFVHWIIFNIPGSAHGLPQGMPNVAGLPDGSMQLKNSNNQIGYMGMGAPSPGPAHHYTFEVFALDTRLNLGPDASQADVLKGMSGHVLDKGVLVGRFHLP
jgi:Raf kinase inhibitor-like YbhB/YbcL family protein